MSLIRDLAANLLEVPEEATEQLGRLFTAIGDEFDKMSARIDELEKMVRGGEDNAPPAK